MPSRICALSFIVDIHARSFFFHGGVGLRSEAAYPRSIRVEQVEDFPHKQRLD